MFMQGHTARPCDDKQTKQTSAARMPLLMLILIWQQEGPRLTVKVACTLLFHNRKVKVWERLENTRGPCCLGTDWITFWNNWKAGRQSERWIESLTLGKYIIERPFDQLCAICMQMWQLCNYIVLHLVKNVVGFPSLYYWNVFNLLYFIILSAN